MDSYIRESVGVTPMDSYIRGCTMGPSWSIAYKKMCEGDPSTRGHGSIKRQCSDGPFYNGSLGRRTP